MEEQTYTTDSAEKTQGLGENIAKNLRGGEVILLHGDLGSGKTTFTQGLAHGLGVSGRVTSPTFLIVRSYTLDNHSTLEMLYHIDAYRLSGAKETAELGLQEIFSDPKAVVVCEWPERIAELLPKKNITINFTYLNENERRIEIKG